MQGKLIKTNTFAEQQYEASMLAEEKMEELRNFSNLTVYNAIATGSSTYSGRNASYTINWTVTTSTTPADKDIQITVSWTSSANTSESIVIDSTIASADPIIAGRVIESYSPVTP